MGMRLTLAYCMQAAGYKFEPLDPDCEKLMDTGMPLVGLVPLRTLVLDSRQQSSRKLQSAKQPGDEAPAISSTIFWSMAGKASPAKARAAAAPSSGSSRAGVRPFTVRPARNSWFRKV